MAASSNTAGALASPAAASISQQMLASAPSPDGWPVTEAVIGVVTGDWRSAAMARSAAASPITARLASIAAIAASTASPR
jgi:hypothetical protein